MGMFLTAIPYLLVAVLIEKESGFSIGGGDIKLMAVAGFFLGWKKILLSLMLGSIAGSVVGVALIVMKIIKRKQPIPFGPYLCIGIFASALFGEQIIRWYLNLFL